MAFEKQMAGLPEPFVVLFLASPVDYMAQNLALLREFVNQRKMAGIYITINRPYASLVSLLKTEKIDTSRMFFIDLITKTLHDQPSRKNDCIFMGSATNLTDLSVAISQAVSANQNEKKFIFLDSLSTMLLYNEAGTLSKFSHFLTGRLREWNVDGVFISLDTQSDKELTENLSQFCDRVVKV
jgi:KaiC/GvpD/RAD55 family RecA-like ATPase